MSRGLFCAALSALALSSIAVVLVPAPPAAADGVRVRHHHQQHQHHRRFVLLPERHVVETNRPTSSGSYTINGTGFSARTASCAGWAAGERIKLLAGDWNGACTTAVFYNVRRRQACEMSCD
jgi:hypothetical protein